MAETVAELQEELGVIADGLWGPITQRAFLQSFVNRNAPALTEADYRSAARKLGCTIAQVKAFAEVESGRSSFSFAGRPVILFEAHYFSRLTGHRYDRSHPSISSRRWTRRLYARTMPGRYGRLALACSLDPNAGLSSASWGKFQVMGAHWKALGYPSAWNFAQSMVQSEAAHLIAFTRFIEVNRLTRHLRACRANDPDSCRGVVKRYNGPAYEKNNYHVRLARAIAKHQ